MISLYLVVRADDKIPKLTEKIPNIVKLIGSTNIINKIFGLRLSVCR